MRRLLVILIGLLTLGFGFIDPPAGMANSPLPPTAYAYDGRVTPMEIDGTTTERGPPVMCSHPTTYDVNGPAPRGASGRPGGSALLAERTYDDREGLALVTSATATTSGRAEVSNGEPSSTHRWRVDAKSGDDLTRVGRWMGDDKLRPDPGSWTR